MKTSGSPARAIRGILIALVTACWASPALADRPAPTCDAKPLVVKIHADWCGSCRATQQVWAKVEADLADEATIVELDVSDRVAYQTSLAEAQRLGIGEFFQEFSRRTGAIAVLDCETRKPVAVLSGERDFGKYRAAIHKAGAPS